MSPRLPLICSLIVPTAGMFGADKESTPAVPAKGAGDRPNIIWVVSEDLGADLGCYGHPDADTPNLDRLASQGRLYTRAYSPSPVCSASRSAFATGMYQTSIGAHHHRSHRGDGYQLPAGVKVVSEWLREAGYHTGRLVEFPAGTRLGGFGKLDWNFNAPGQAFDTSNWDELKSRQPFYGQMSIFQTHRPYSKPKKMPGTDKVTLPPYLADHPLIVRWPGKVPAGSTSDELVSPNEVHGKDPTGGGALRFARRSIRAEELGGFAGA